MKEKWQGEMFMADKNEFGKTIIQLRKEKGYTQKELADKLNVSDKAVSRWETGKNYPDIETLQHLAVELNVSVNELLSGNLQLVKKVNKHIKAGIITIVIIVLLYMFPLWHLLPVMATDFYSARDATYLMFRGLPTNRLQVSDIMDTAEAAFSDVESTYDEAEKKYGMLGSYYSNASDINNEVVSENHRLRVWSVILNPSPTDEHEGYMWVCYRSEGLDKDGNVACGSGWAPALWYLDKDKNGNWYVKDIKEAP